MQQRWQLSENCGEDNKCPLFPLIIFVLSKSCLLDPWPTFLIKECIALLLPLHTKLVNCSLMEGCVPDALKTVVVTPLIKKANLPPDHLKNYCPESGLNFISKLVERVVNKQLLDHIHVLNLDNLY